MEKETKKTTGYKGFDKDMKCRGFQYEIGKEYECEEPVKLCESGFHFCEYPHEVFFYYPAGNNSRFAIVEAEGVSEEHGKDSKRVSKKLKINAEISVFEICRMAVRVFFENFGFKGKVASTDAANAGNRGAANAGDRGAANAGNRGAANAGDCGAANAGNRGAANAGDCGAANAGDGGAANAGNRGAANAGNRGAANAGNWGAASAGNWGAAIVSNKGKVKGKKGCVLVARNIEWNVCASQYEVSDWACGIVDGVNIKEDTWYHLENGKLVECEEQ